MTGIFERAMKAIALMTGLLPVVGCQDQGDLSKHVFLPHISASLRARARLDVFNEVIEQFAREQSLFLERGTYKADHEVENVEIGTSSADPQIFIRLSNRKKTDVFEISLYSHQDAKIWKPMWKEFMRALAAAYASKDIILDPEDK